MRFILKRRVVVILSVVAGLLVFVYSACDQLEDGRLRDIPFSDKGGSGVAAGASETGTRQDEAGSSVSAGAAARGEEAAEGGDAIPGTTSPPVAEKLMSDYEYNKRLRISGDTYEVQTITKWHPGNEDKVVHLLRILRDEVVPQAVVSLVRRFPKTFGHMADKSIEMGIALNSLETSVVASMDSRIPNDESTQYGLTIGYNRLNYEFGSLSSNSRKELEAYVAHEIMHGLMSEALTRAYFGIERYPAEEKSKRFPLWFQEGVAEAVCGSARALRVRLSKQYPLNVLNGTEELDVEIEKEQLYVTKDDIRGFISQYPLNGSTSVSAYQTGWMAVMYLGHRASGSSDISPKSIAAGLDKLMSQVYRGESLSQAIREHCGFQDLALFQASFNEGNSDVVRFVVELMNSIGSGRGSVLVDSYRNFASIPNDSDLLDDSALDCELFWLRIGPQSICTNKIYGDDYPLLEGGFGN